MKIAFDGRVLERSMTGIGRYLINILEELPKHNTGNEYYVFTNKPQNHVKNNFFKYITANKPFINSKIFTPFWLNYILPSLLEKENIDILIGPNILIPTTKIKNCKKISIVHDIIPLTHPDLFPFFYRNFLKMNLPSSIKSSDLIITISEASKKTICNYFEINEQKVKVVYNTISRNFRKLTNEELKTLEKKSQLKIPEKFLFYVGVIEKRKNIEMLLNIAKNIDSIDSNLKLIMAGKPGYKFELYEARIKELSDKIIYLNQINDDDLLLLYNKAAIFLFPSLIEGFGLPPIEAMACGTPVIASDCDAMKEIIGDAGILCETNNLNSYLSSINLLLKDKNYSLSFSEKAQNRIKIFNRENMIKSFLNALENVK